MNKKLVRKKLRATGNHPEDIDGMIQTYIWLHKFPYFKQVVDLWERSDSLVYEMDSLAHRVRAAWQSDHTFAPQKRKSMKQKVIQLDHELSVAQKSINAKLGQGVRMLESLTFWSATGAGLLLMVIGFLFTYRFRKSIRKWRRSLMRSEKRYRSLFDYNPNAVFSLDTEGQFLSGNKALERMTGYTNEELKQMTFMPLVHPDYVEKVQKYFQRAAEGDPQSYESVGVHKDGSEYEVHVTNLPIIVDDKIEGVYGIAQDITDRKEAERKLRRSLEEKKTLLAEIHHRVKNNLAIISGLLELQADGMEENELKYDLLNTQSRIHSMAMVHEKLYKSSSFSEIHMPEYLRDLARAIQETMEQSDTQVEVTYDMEEVSLDITQAIPTGLLVNEMVVNAFKYAFSDRREGEIYIGLKQKDEQVLLEVSDNGTGLPDDLDFESSQSLGITLIRSLTRQLEGDIDISDDNGTTYEIQFRKKPPSFYQTTMNKAESI